MSNPPTPTHAEDVFDCVLCSQPAVGWGHNPRPLADEGRACTSCNSVRVIPARVRGLVYATVEDQLRAQHGRIWTTQQLREDFQVDAFLAPFVHVTRKSDGALGTLQFTHRPRYYFQWRADA